ncbi:MAG TPA: hypothetical protein VHI55_02365 [Gaiellaceae bacterium]|jgi:hypothetical protein|nr:hypothetical protein [Gaiellaceae bacterium]
MTHTFRLERLDGAPADPPTFRTVATRWEPDDTIPLARAERFRSFAFATTTPTSRTCWSFRTWPKERLAPSSDVRERMEHSPVVEDFL